MKKVLAFAAVVLFCSMTSVMAQGGGEQRTPEEQRFAALIEKLKPLNLTAVQTDSAIAIFNDHRLWLRQLQGYPPESRWARIEEITELRNKRLERALPAYLAKKVIETMSQRPGGVRQ